MEIDAEQVAALAADEPRARRVGRPHPATGVQHEHGVADAVEQRGEQRAHRGAADAAGIMVAEGTRMMIGPRAVPVDTASA